MAYYLFPFEKILSGERVIIYGAGNVGQSFFQQIQLCKYCQIVALADKAYEKYGELPVRVIPPSDIGEYGFDKIVVAIDNRYTAEGVLNELTLRLQIPSHKIVLAVNRKIENRKVEAIPLPAPCLDDDAIENQLNVAFYITGGLGDCIIRKRVFTAFLELLKQVNMNVVIYTEAHSQPHINALFTEYAGRYALKLGMKTFVEEAGQYDLSVYIGYFLRIFSLNVYRWEKYAPGIWLELQILQAYWEKYDLDVSHDVDNGIHFARCAIKHQNCYTAYDSNGILDMSDWHVTIPLDMRYEAQWKQLDLSRYITLSYGWGLNDNEKEKVPNKIWPFPYYEKLIELLRDRFCDIQIVQLGVRDSRKLSGASRYVFGQNIELVKHILCKSQLHIDCEGGLVHLASQLGTKCAVMFGPTPKHYFGYACNINISAGSCKNCCYLEKDFTACLRDLSQAQCMYDIRPEMVMEAIYPYLQVAES